MLSPSGLDNIVQAKSWFSAEDLARLAVVGDGSRGVCRVAGREFYWEGPAGDGRDSTHKFFHRRALACSKVQFHYFSAPEQITRRALPAPLAMLRRGRSYVFELSNISKQFHPIHIHGHSFTVLSSNKAALPRHFADTVLLAPRERVEVAFVADNPGDWMFHCHLIEHQETGMMGYVRVA
jgi:hypothetical protein